MLRKNAVTCRKASRSIEAIQRGDDTFRFACQALAASLFELTNADLTMVCNQLGVPALGDKDDDETPVETPAEAPAAAETPAAETPAAETPAATPAETTPAEDMFGLSTTPSAAPAEDMFATMQAAPAALTKERATAMATIAEAQMEKLNNDLDAAMADDKTEECEKLSEEIESLESYAGELKKFAAGTVTEEPKAPSCFDEHFASKNAGDDLFLGM
jgi:singapore isolate B (sub-type 7) whole genome shotgun sequence assembly, scaffold_4